MTQTNARPDRNLCLLQTSRVALAVKAFVMMLDKVTGVLQAGKVRRTAQPYSGCFLISAYSSSVKRPASLGSHREHPLANVVQKGGHFDCRAGFFLDTKS